MRQASSTTGRRQAVRTQGKAHLSQTIRVILPFIRRKNSSSNLSELRGLAVHFSSTNF
jgi:hypothetical protein